MAGFVPQAGDVVMARIPAQSAGCNSRDVRVRVRAVDLRPLYAGWVWLVGDELSEGNGRAGTVFLLVEPDCLWPSSTAAG